MRKLFLFLLMIGLVIVFAKTIVFAEVKTASLEGKVKSDVDVIKEKIASKVAELTEKEKKVVISGKVVAIKDDQIILLTNTTLNERKKISIDPQLTKYFQLEKGKKKEIEKSVIAKDDYLIIPGLVLDNVVANTIYRTNPYFVSSGKITAVDKKAYTINVLSADKDEYVFDIERTTRQKILDPKTLTVKKAGFSKLKEGDRLHFVYQLVSKDKKNQQKNRYPLVRYLIIPQEYFAN